RSCSPRCSAASRCGPRPATRSASCGAASRWRRRQACRSSSTPWPPSSRWRRRRWAAGSAGRTRWTERAQLRLLRGGQLALDLHEQAEFGLLHLCPEGSHLIQLREHGRLIEVVGGEEPVQRLGFGVEPPLEVDELLLRLAHRLLDGIDLGLLEAELLLVL